MPHITPTNGRVVLYTPAEAQYSIPCEGLKLAAIISHVHPDGSVNLAIFGSDGTMAARKHVPLVQEGDLIPAGGYAQWMPYQLGQAAKTDSVTTAALTRLEEQAKRIDELQAKLDKLAADAHTHAPEAVVQSETAPSPGATGDPLTA